MIDMTTHRPKSASQASIVKQQRAKSPSALLDSNKTQLADTTAHRRISLGSTQPGTEANGASNKNKAADQQPSRRLSAGGASLTASSVPAAVARLQVQQQQQLQQQLVQQAQQKDEAMKNLKQYTLKLQTQTKDFSSKVEQQDRIIADLKNQLNTTREQLHREIQSKQQWQQRYTRRAQDAETLMHYVAAIEQSMGGIIPNNLLYSSIVSTAAASTSKNVLDLHAKVQEIKSRYDKVNVQENAKRKLIPSNSNKNFNEIHHIASDRLANTSVMSWQSQLRNEPSTVPTGKKHASNSKHVLSDSAIIAALNGHNSSLFNDTLSHSMLANEHSDQMGNSVALSDITNEIMNNIETENNSIVKSQQAKEDQLTSYLTRVLTKAASSLQATNASIAPYQEHQLKAGNIDNLQLPITQAQQTPKHSPQPPLPKTIPPPPPIENYDSIDENLDTLHQQLKERLQELSISLPSVNNSMNNDDESLHIAQEEFSGNNINTVPPQLSTSPKQTIKPMNQSPKPSPNSQEEKIAREQYLKRVFQQRLEEERRKYGLI